MKADPIVFQRYWLGKVRKFSRLLASARQKAPQEYAHQDAEAAIELLYHAAATEWDWL